MTITLDGTLGITTPSETNTGTLSVTGVTTLTGGLNAALPVLSGGTGVTTKTGTGAVVLGTGPTITGATITVAATAAPAFSAYYAGASQSIASGTFTKALFDTELFDTSSCFASSRFTPTVAGYYQINATLNFSGTFTRAITSIYKSGAEYVRGSDLQVSTVFKSSASTVVYLNGTTDYIEIYAYQIGTSLVLNSDSTNMQFSGAMIRSA